MTSKAAKEAFVWIWLPGETEPVVAGRLAADGGNLCFNYGQSYLARGRNNLPVMPIYLPELPLQAGVLPLLEGLIMPGCIRDAAPDAWGRRVIMNKKCGSLGRDTAELDELTYLLESGSDRIGALDFQRSSSVYEPRFAKNVGMEELLASAERVEQGMRLTPELDQALVHGSSIGGARPKVLIEDVEDVEDVEAIQGVEGMQGQGKKYIAKFSSSTDLFSVVKAEYVAMRLAALVGLRVAPVKLIKVANKDVLLIERFDRLPQDGGWSRKVMVSALTLFGLQDMMARYASYETLAQIIRHRFTDPKDNLRELFARLVFNVLSGNTDDHARNHAAFWDGKALMLTPAYDICPQGRTGNEATQAMLIAGNNNLSQLKTCLETAKNFLLSEQEARILFEHVRAGIEQHWQTVCDEAGLSEVDQSLLWGRQFLNPYSLIIE